MERKISMLGRHLIRIKVLQSLYAYKSAENPEFSIFYKELELSLNKSYEQYLILLLILAELRNHAEFRIVQIQERQIKNEAEWQRLTRLANNKVLQQLCNNADFAKLCSDKKLSLDNYKVAFKEIFNNVISSDFYEEYLQTDDTYLTDKTFARTALMNVVAETESLFDSFEEFSIYWNDDVDNTVSMVEKTLKNFKENNSAGGEILQMFADAETHDFGYTLFTKAVKHWAEVNKYIDKNLQNWKQERVAIMDIIILQTAITEMIEFTEIPIPVTMNEYIEIAKWYSTQKSGIFVNGILYKVAEDLKNEGKIKKVGRGLIQNK